MFWRFGGYAQLSSLDSILDKPDVTVEELLDESDLIQELKQQNSKLIEYLRDENVLERLLRYVIATKQAATPEEESGGDGAGVGARVPRRDDDCHAAPDEFADRLIDGARGRTLEA